LVQTPPPANAEPSFHAQYGEDRILASLFANRPVGTCVEVGAFDGVTGSNTFYFEQRGWRCVLIEANPDSANRCRALRPGSTVFPYAVVGPSAAATVTFQVAEQDPQLSAVEISPLKMRAVPDRLVSEVRVQAKTLDEILTEANLGDRDIDGLDFVTIDVEGHEFEVLQGFTLANWRPKWVILERNYHFPEYRLVKHMRDHGYLHQRRTGVNDWFLDVGRAEAGRTTNTLQFIWRLYLRQVPTAARPLARDTLIKLKLLR
jgi:FkbM family methyltransferase